MSSIDLVKGKDGKGTILIIDEATEKGVNLTGWSLIKLVIKKEDGTDLVMYAPLSSAVNEIQKIAFDAVPDEGTWSIQFGDEVTSALAFNADAATVQAALNALFELSAVTVAGDYTAGFTITFAGDDGGREQALFVAPAHTLKTASVANTLTITEETKGQAVNGVNVADINCGELTVNFSEDQVNELEAADKQDADLFVRIGSNDLNIPILKGVINVEERS